MINYDEFLSKNVPKNYIHSFQNAIIVGFLLRLFIDVIFLILSKDARAVSFTFTYLRLLEKVLVLRWQRVNVSCLKQHEHWSLTGLNFVAWLFSNALYRHSCIYWKVKIYYIVLNIVHTCTKYICIRLLQCSSHMKCVELYVHYMFWSRFQSRVCHI